MADPDRLTRSGARLIVEWLNRRFETSFDIADPEGDALIAVDGDHRLGIYIAPLWDTEPSEPWPQLVHATEERLAAGAPDGAYFLWVPPKASLPDEEPDASDFVQRVQTAAAPLPPGSRTEVTFPVPVRMGKMREEGGYASVVGGLSRWWTRITEKVDGTFHVESSAVHRLTMDGEAREKLWDTIGRLSHSVAVGQQADFEVEEAWTLQRLPESEHVGGFTIVGAPPSVDPTDGIFVRRMARRRLQAANDVLSSLDVDLRVVGLVSIYEYAELEGAGATVKALDPALFSQLEVVAVLADGEVRPTFLPRALPWSP